MTKFHKLAQLNKDIELLESYGDFKSADILHNKFIRLAQIKPTSYATEDRGYTYEKYFNGKLKKLQNAQNKDLVISEIRSDGFLKEEDKLQIINAISSNQTERSTQNSERQPQIGKMELATTPVPDIGPNPDPRDDVSVSPQSTSNRGDGLTVNKGNIIYSEDTANQNAKELSAEEMKKRIQYYEDKINEYHNLKNNPKYKEKMLLYLTTYMDNNYDQGKLDSNSYSRLMNALGEKSGIS